MSKIKDNLEVLAIIDELREEVRQLRAALSPPVNPFYGKLGLTPQLAALLNAFYLHGDMPQVRLDAVISQHTWGRRCDDPAVSPTRGRVAVCKLRAALRPHGVEIDLVRGMGYRLDPANKAKLTALLEGLT
jgi:DNA-binding response OmpR family regulator